MFPPTLWQQELTFIFAFKPKKQNTYRDPILTCSTCCHPLDTFPKVSIATHFYQNRNQFDEFGKVTTKNYFKGSLDKHFILKLHPALIAWETHSQVESWYNALFQRHLKRAYHFHCNLIFKFIELVPVQTNIDM